MFKLLLHTPENILLPSPKSYSTIKKKTSVTDRITEILEREQDEEINHSNTKEFSHLNEIQLPDSSR